MRKVFLMFLAVLFLVNCGSDPFMGPDGVEVPKAERTARSDLGFWIVTHRDYTLWGGTVTKEHEDLADRWWMELMNDLYNAGYVNTASDPTNIFGHVSIKLRKPRGEQGLIYCDNISGLQGACYHRSTHTIEVPGDYPTSTLPRPNSQPSKHEMLHHFCFKKLGHNCRPKKGENKGKHIWPAPNDPSVNIWDFTWDRDQSSTGMSHQQYLETMFVEQHELDGPGGDIY